MFKFKNLTAKITAAVLAGIMVVGVTASWVSAASGTLDISSIGDSYIASTEEDGTGNANVPEVLKGDVNSDGEVNSIDLQYAKRYLLIINTRWEPWHKPWPPWLNNFENLDMDGDGVIDSIDIALLKRKILRKI